MAALLAVSLAGLTSCGVPTQGGPRAISRSRVPSRLLDRSPQTTTTTTEPRSTEPITIYFIRTGLYVAPVPRSVPPSATLKSVLQVLVTTGPSTVDASNGFQSAFGRGVKVIGATVAGSLATVDFNKQFGLISGSQGALAVAQVVYTVTANETTVTLISFQIDGQPTEVFGANGALVQGPVTAAQYASLLHPPTPPTTTAPGSTTTTARRSTG